MSLVNFFNNKKPENKVVIPETTKTKVFNNAIRTANEKILTVRKELSLNVFKWLLFQISTNKRGIPLYTSISGVSYDDERETITITFVINEQMFFIDKELLNVSSEKELLDGLREYAISVEDLHKNLMILVGG